VDSPHVSRSIRLVEHNALQNDIVHPWQLPDEPMPFGAVLWNSQDEIIMRTWGQSDEQGVELRDVNLLRNQRAKSQYFTRLPMRSFIKSVRYCAQADRVAWLLCEDKPRGPAKAGLYVCNTDGSDFREIGSVRGKVVPYNLWEPNDLRWLPDGHHLSFVFHKSLYMVAVD
jgi:hypothetical protein